MKSVFGILILGITVLAATLVPRAAFAESEERVQQALLACPNLPNDFLSIAMVEALGSEDFKTREAARNSLSQTIDTLLSDPVNFACYLEKIDAAVRGVLGSSSDLEVQRRLQSIATWAKGVVSSSYLIGAEVFWPSGGPFSPNGEAPWPNALNRRCVLSDNLAVASNSAQQPYAAAGCNITRVNCSLDDSIVDVAPRYTCRAESDNCWDESGEGECPSNSQRVGVLADCPGTERGVVPVYFCLADTPRPAAPMADGGAAEELNQGSPTDSHDDAPGADPSDGGTEELNVGIPPETTHEPSADFSQTLDESVVDLSIEDQEAPTPEDVLGSDPSTAPSSSLDDGFAATCEAEAQ